MSGYSNENRGAIWGNKEKTEQNPTWCDFKGSINIEGKEFWLEGWTRKKDAKSGSPSMTLRVKAKDDVHKQGVDNASQAAQGSNTPEFDADSDIPF